MDTCIQNKTLTRKIKPLTRSWIKPRKGSDAKRTRPRGTFKLQGQSKNQWAHRFSLWIQAPVCSPELLSLLWSPYGPPKQWPKSNRLPVISPAKKKKRQVYSESAENYNSIFCNHGELTCKSPHGKWRRMLLLRGKSTWEGKLSEESMTFHWLSPCQERRGIFLPLVQLHCCHRCESSSPGPLTLFNWSFCLLVFLIELRAILGWQPEINFLSPITTGNELYQQT